MFQVLAQNALNALQLGSVYALIALGYTMVYGILTMINFAHGDIFMVGTYLSLAGAVFLLGLPLHVPLVLVFLGALTFSMLLTALLGVTIERLAYRPLRQAPRVSAVITALGVGLFLENVTLGLLGPEPRHFPDLIPLASWQVAGLTITPLQVLIIVMAAVLMVLLDLLVRRTLLGMAMRAISYNRPIVPLMGVLGGPGHFADLCHRLRHRRRGRPALRLGLPRAGPPHGGAHRLVGLYRRGGRRHRQYPGGHAGGLYPGSRGGLYAGAAAVLHLPGLRGFLHAPDPAGL